MTHENYKNLYIKLPPRKIPKEKLLFLILARRICKTVRADAYKWYKPHFYGMIYVAQPRQKDGVLIWQRYKILSETGSWSYGKTESLLNAKYKNIPEMYVKQNMVRK